MKGINRMLKGRNSVLAKGYFPWQVSRKAGGHGDLRTLTPSVFDLFFPGVSITTNVSMLYYTV